MYITKTRNCGYSFSQTVCIRQNNTKKGMLARVYNGVETKETSQRPIIMDKSLKDALYGICATLEIVGLEAEK